MGKVTWAADRKQSGEIHPSHVGGRGGGMEGRRAGLPSSQAEVSSVVCALYTSSESERRDGLDQGEAPVGVRE